MGLGSLFGGKSKKATVTCLVIGEDRKLSFRNLEATGVFFLDNSNRLAYDSLPEAIGVCTQVRNGKEKYRGQVSIIYEAMARPFSFVASTWAQVDQREEVILASARSEGSSKAIQSMENADRFDKMSTILLLLVAGVIGMALLFALQSGILSDIFHSIRP